jgi:hypothetical protein
MFLGDTIFNGFFLRILWRLLTCLLLGDNIGLIRLSRSYVVDGLVLIHELLKNSFLFALLKRDGLFFEMKGMFFLGC